jgi:hypothetical protein
MVLSSCTRSPALMLRSQLGLALVGPDRLAGFGGLLHEWLQFWLWAQAFPSELGIKGPPSMSDGLDAGRLTLC